MIRHIIFLSLFISCGSVSIAQPHEIKSIRDFGAKGDGKSNDQVAFEKASTFFNNRKGNGTLVIPKGTYLVGEQEVTSAVRKRDVMHLTNCKNFSMEGKGAVIKFRDSLRFGAFIPASSIPFHTTQPVFTDYPYAVSIGTFLILSHCERVTLKNLEVDGNQKGMILGGQFGDHGFQLPNNGIFIEDCNQVLMDSLYVHHMGCDGIQISNKTTNKKATPDQLIALRNSRFEYNGRQGLSWVGGSGLKAFNCKFNFTGRGRFSTAPASGVDIEAEIGIIQNGMFDSCEFIDNSACGLVADSGESMDMNFNHCIFWGTSSWSMWTTKPNFNFHHCQFYGSIVQGYNAPDEKTATKFIQCTFEDKPYHNKPAYGKYLLEINFKRRMMFDQCTFISSSKKLWWFDGDPNWKDEEKPIMKNARIIMKATTFPDGDFISVKNCLREGGSVYELYYKKDKKYYEAGSKNVNLGNNKLVWKK